MTIENYITAFNTGSYTWYFYFPFNSIHNFLGFIYDLFFLLSFIPVNSVHLYYLRNRLYIVGPFDSFDCPISNVKTRIISFTEWWYAICPQEVCASGSRNKWNCTIIIFNIKLKQMSPLYNNTENRSDVDIKLQHILFILKHNFW